MLVERIYEYGKSVKALDEKARLIVFNCAEYAENPQLILAQLFGYKKEPLRVRTETVRDW